MTAFDGSLRASFPTALLGSDSTQNDTCTTNLDNIGYVHGISSYALGAFPSVLATFLCGKSTRRVFM